MSFLRSLSIRSKLVLLAVVSVAIALLLAGSSVVLNEMRILRQAKVEQLQSQARMLSFNSTAVLTFQDSEAAKQLLASLAMQPSVEYACLRDAQGQILADYRTADADATTPPPSETDGWRFTSSGNLDLAQTIVDQGEAVGTVFLRANMDDYHSQLVEQLKRLAFNMACALGVSIALSFFLQRAISHPISELSEAARSITTDRDYSIRVREYANNELGRLCLAFNRMLDEIEVSKNALQSANDHLEQRVAERTDQLTAEIDKKEHIQQDLLRAKEAAEAASRAKSEFLANMSHEIRTPLNGVLGFTNLLLKGVDGGNEDTRRDYLETIENSGEHLLTLLNDILDLSKIEAGQLTIEPVPCSPHEVISHVVSISRAEAHRKGLELSYKWRSPIPETIETDSGRLRQLLMNLVGNAVKFTERGHVKIAAWVDPANQRLHLDVEDTGIGIPSDKLEEIFDPFRQADNSVTRRFGGTGLGLPISRHVAEALGGQLTVSSEPGKGSSFHVVIATGSLEDVLLHDALAADALIKPITPEHGDARTLPASRVLLVEDGPTNRKLLRVVLEDAGAEVATAENGLMALRLLESREFDAVLMDMQMPVMDGYAATRRIREMGITIPVIALTAHAMKGDAEKCQDAGCNHYLTKPISPDRLIAALLGAIRSESPGVLRPSEGTRAPNTRDDSSQLVSTLPMGREIYREIVAEFAELANHSANEMRLAVSREDFERLAELAHEIKGAGGTAGFDAFTAPARALEKAAKVHDSGEVVALTENIAELASRIVLPSITADRTEAAI